MHIEGNNIQNEQKHSVPYSNRIVYQPENGRSNINTSFQDDIASEVQNNVQLAHTYKSYREPDARGIYKALGKKRLLAPHWPKEYGGQNRPFQDTVKVLETLNEYGVSDFLYFLSILFVGDLLIKYACDNIKNKLLKKIGCGEIFCSVLYTEPDSGTDLESIQGRAYFDNGYYKIYSKKIYSLKTSQANYALCLVKTGNNCDRFKNMTIFLVDLESDKISIKEMHSTTKEKFHLVELQGALVDEDSIIGGLNNGWEIVNEALLLERIGLDYYLKSKKWLKFLIKYSAVPNNILIELQDKVEMSKNAVYCILERLEQNEILADYELAKIKYYTSELARKVGGCLLKYPPRNINNQSGEVRNEYESIITESPTTTISGGCSEVMLEIIASRCF